MQACSLTNDALSNQDIAQRLGQEQQATDLANAAVRQDAQWSTIAAHMQTFHDLSSKEFADNGLPSAEKDEQINTAYTIRDECTAVGVEVVIPD